MNTWIRTRNLWIRTHNSWIQTRNSWIRTRNSWIQTRNAWIQTRNSWIQTRNSWIRTCTFEFQLMLLNFQLVLLSFQLVTCNSCFTISRVKRITLCNCKFVLFLLLVFVPAISRILGNTEQQTDHWTANKTQLFIPIKRKFFGPIFFRSNHSEGELPRGYLINIASCLFAYDIYKH